MSPPSKPSSPSSSIITSFLQWLRLKNYQYEVTFALYMLTPTEKFIFSKRPIYSRFPFHSIPFKNSNLHSNPESASNEQFLLWVDTLVLSIVSLFFTAAYVYLPDHVALIYGRIHYYFTADVSMIKDYIPSPSSILQGGGPATGALNVVYETVSGAASTAALDELWPSHATCQRRYQIFYRYQKN